MTGVMSGGNVSSPGGYFLTPGGTDAQSVALTSHGDTAVSEHQLKSVNISSVEIIAHIVGILLKCHCAKSYRIQLT